MRARVTLMGNEVPCETLDIADVWAPSHPVRAPRPCRSATGEVRSLAAHVVRCSEVWSGLRESNPSDWLGKPGHYHYAKPAFEVIVSGSGLRAQGSRPNLSRT